VTIRLAGAPVSWGVDFAGAPGNPAPAVVLDGIAAAGLRWMELGPAGYLPARRAPLEARGLRGVGTFVFEAFAEGPGPAELLGASRRALDAIDALGGETLVLVDRPQGHRARSAGRAGAARRLDERGWRRLRDVLRRVAEQARDRGVRAVVHPHAGSHVEFADEIDRLMAETEPGELGLCLDTGHALYAGDDPVACLRRHGPRVLHLHLKDVRAPALEESRQRGADFWTTMERGIFCPLGSGLLDLAGLGEALEAVGYAGFATIEQDRRPLSPGRPEDDLRASVRALGEAWGRVLAAG
jgi:inosose dehydratase